jgi:hypothetical protein
MLSPTFPLRTERLLVYAMLADDWRARARIGESSGTAGVAE